MKKIDQRYYEPLEQMMAIRHNYMAKVIQNEFGISIYDFFLEKKVLDLGCGTGKFLHGYYELGSDCVGVDITNNFFIQNKEKFKLLNLDLNHFLKKNRLKFDVIFLFEFLEHLTQTQRKILFNNLRKMMNSNGVIFISTLNRNPISKFFSINIAENFLKLLPKDTHDPELFLKPSELENLAKKNNLSLKNTQGISYNPLLKSFRLSNIDLINYFATISN